MRASILSLALVAAPSVVSASGTLGFSLGNKNADGSCKVSADWTADLKAIAAGSTARVVRTYAANECDTAKGILPAAKNTGFKVILGIWIANDEDNTSYDADTAAIVANAPKYADQVYAITVGSETLYRGNMTGDQLASKIQDVKKQTGSKFKVGTADSWSKYQDGSADPLIKGGADILLTNAFSYWQGQTLQNSTGSFFDDVMQAFSHIQDVAGGPDKTPELWVGETGWPTAGNNYQQAVPGTNSAKTFWQKGVCGALDWGVNVFFFEAFDESWKPVSVGLDGTVADETHWGAWTADRTPKWDISC